MWKYDGNEKQRILRRAASWRFSSRQSSGRTVRSFATNLTLFVARASEQNTNLFQRHHLVHRVVQRIKSFSECNTDLHVLLQRNELSIVAFSAVVCPLQKNIPKWFIACIAILFSIRLENRNRISTNKTGWAHCADWRWYRSFLERKVAVSQV